MNERASTTPPLGTRLHDEHEAFDRRFRELSVRAYSDDWHDLDEVWSAFAADVEAHLRLEEEEVFPTLRERGPAQAELVARLVAEHDEIRRRLFTLGVEIQVHAIRADTIDAFLAAMRRHAERENAELYPGLK